MQDLWKTLFWEQMKCSSYLFREAACFTEFETTIKRTFKAVTSSSPDIVNISGEGLTGAFLTAKSKLKL